MSTATLPREARRNVVAFFAAGKEAKEVSQDPTSGFSKTWTQVDGKRVLQVKNMPVFRSGTFRDSMGIQHTWDDIHMDQMVQHFDLLRQRSLLEHLPVRKGHPGFLTNPSQVVDDIIGYHTALRVARMKNPADGIEYNYLFADYDILDPTAAEKIDNGLWRNMSAEVGHWFTNSEAEYWPVYSGVAYCDFSAVEGLKNYSSANGVGSTVSVMTDEQEQNVTAPTPPVPTPPAGVPTPPVPTPPQQTQQTATAPEGQHSAPAAPATQFAFMVGGQQITDFASVQGHLTRLEQENNRFSQQFREQVEAGRIAFVKELVDANLVTAGEQQTSTEAFAKSLDDTQFTAWKGQWAHALPKPGIGVVAGGGQQFQANQGLPVGSAAGQESDEIKTALEIVANFQRTNMKADEIKETASYKKLVAAGKAPNLG